MLTIVTGVLIAWCVCQSVTRLRSAKTAARIEVLFGLETPGTHCVRWKSWCPPRIRCGLRQITSATCLCVMQWSSLSLVMFSVFIIQQSIVFKYIKHCFIICNQLHPFSLFVADMQFVRYENLLMTSCSMHLLLAGPLKCGGTGLL